MEEQQTTERRFPLERGGGWGYLWYGAALVLVVLTAGYVGFSAKPTSPSASPTPSPTPSTAANAAKAAVVEAGKSLIESKKGRQWLMEASKVKWKDVGKQAHVDSVDWTLRSPRGKNVVAVKAPGAEVFVDESRVQFQGMVDTYRFATGDHVLGRDMIWDGKKSLLMGDHGVRWAKGTTVITADHMTASDQLERIHLRGHVKITTMIDGNPLGSSSPKPPSDMQHPQRPVHGGEAGGL